MVEVVPVDTSGATFAPIGLGQSLFSNYAPVRTMSTGPGRMMAAWGQVARLADPILGGDGDGGSIWPALVDALLGPSDHGAVVTVIAAGGLPISTFMPGSEGYIRLEAEVRWRRKVGLHTTHVMIQQGQGDIREMTPADCYASRLRTVVEGVNALLPGVPVVVAIDSYRHGRAHPWLAEAQREGARRGGARLGPDLDRIGCALRADGTHYNAAGQRAAAEAWAEALSQQARTERRPHAQAS